MSKNKYYVIIQVLLCLLISFVTCLMFEIPIVLSSHIDSELLMLDISRICIKILLCTTTGVVFAKKCLAETPCKDQKTLNFYKKHLNIIYSTYVVLLLLLLGIYYFIPQINWTLSDVVSFRRSMYPTTFESIFSIITTSLISVSSVAAYVACAISYILVRWKKLHRLLQKDA